MKTKKALAGLLGLFGSFPAFSFTGFLLPLSFAFLLTDNLQNPNQNVTFPNFSQIKDESRHQNQAIKTEISKTSTKTIRSDESITESTQKTLRKDRKPTHLLSAFFVVSAFDFDPFISKPVGEKLRSVKIEAKTADLTVQIGLKRSKISCKSDSPQLSRVRVSRTSARERERDAKVGLGLVSVCVVRNEERKGG